MSDFRRFIGDGTQPKTKSKPQRSFFEKVDEQFEILYQKAVEKANVQTKNIPGEQSQGVSRHGDRASPHQRFHVRHRDTF